MKLPTSKLLNAIFFQLMASTVVHATDYSADFDIDVSGKHDNNIRLTQSEKTDVTGETTAPALILRADTETTKIALDSKLSFSRYDDSNFNTDDQDINLSLSKEFERGLIRLDAGVLRDSTITSELLGSGRIGNKAERSEQYSVTPFGAIYINENNSLKLSSSYVTRSYRGEGYVGYNNWSNTLDWAYQLNERWTFDFVALYSRFRSDSIRLDVPTSDISLEVLDISVLIPQGSLGSQSYSSESAAKGGQIGATYAFSEDTSLSVLLGRSRNKDSYDISNSDYYCNNDFRRNFAPLCGLKSSTVAITTAVINWSWKGESHQLQANLTKSQQPSSNGYAIDATTLTLDWDYRLTELDRLTLEVTGTRNRELGSDNNQQATNLANRDYGSALIGYHRQISENWYLETSYQYRYQDYRDLDYRANSNVISFGISYHPIAKHWAR